MAVMKSLVVLSLAALGSAQTFTRSNGCPTLGCVYPVDYTEFIAGSVFDIRVEAQAPANGTTAYNGGVPNPNFGLSIRKVTNGTSLPVNVTSFFNIVDPVVERYNFTYFEDLFARDARRPTLVNVLAKSYRHVALYEVGDYVVTFTYNGGATTTARWTVLPLAKKRTAKNVILFVGDGMTTPMITAARLLSHKSVNGKYITNMAMDKAPVLGSQMTHSLDSFITDSANSATALMAGKKSTVNALNTYTDSSTNPFTVPKFETIFEMFRRIYGGKVGIVSTAVVADATPAAVCAHTSERSQSTAITEMYLNGVTRDYPWTRWDGPDVLFGGGAEDYLPSNANRNVSQFDRWAARGYSVVHDNTTLAQIPLNQRALGIFNTGNMPTWLDRNVYKNTLNNSIAWNGTRGTFDLPGLKEMTLKAIDVLSARSKSINNPGWMLMSEAASIDKQMHALDYPRALGELMELDQTIKATLEHLAMIGELEDTLVVVTADHGHGFDVYGSADTRYLREQVTDRAKRGAIGTYEESGLSEYTVAAGSLPDNATVVQGPQGPGFPAQWNVRYGIAAGVVAAPDRREQFGVNMTAPRRPAVSVNGSAFANPNDSPFGFLVNGTLPTDATSGVHSLTDVPVYAWGPGSELFRGVMNSPDIALRIAEVLNLGRSTNVTLYGNPVAAPRPNSSIIANVTNTVGGIVGGAARTVL